MRLVAIEKDGESSFDERRGRGDHTMCEQQGLESRPALEYAINECRSDLMVARLKESNLHDESVAWDGVAGHDTERLHLYHSRHMNDHRRPLKILR